MDNSKSFGVERMCKVFKVSRSGYYHWQGRKPSASEVETQKITAEIKRVYSDSKKRYGSPKITDDLVLASALLDRLLYQCEVINLTGKSYRLQNRKAFFEQKK